MANVRPATKLTIGKMWILTTQCLMNARAATPTGLRPIILLSAVPATVLKVGLRLMSTIRNWIIAISVTPGPARTIPAIAPVAIRLPGGTMLILIITVRVIAQRATVHLVRITPAIALPVMRPAPVGTILFLTIPASPIVKLAIHRPVATGPANAPVAITPMIGST